MAATMADLEAAAAAGMVERWLDGVPQAARPGLRRAIEIDRPLWSRHRGSLASCVLARTMGLDGLGELHARWTRELDARGAPWVAALRPLPVAGTWRANPAVPRILACDDMHVELRGG